MKESKLSKKSSFNFDFGTVSTTSVVFLMVVSLLGRTTCFHTLKVTVSLRNASIFTASDSLVSFLIE